MTLGDAKTDSRQVVIGNKIDVEESKRMVRAIFAQSHMLHANK